jgi:thymidylate kinase
MGLLRTASVTANQMKKRVLACFMGIDGSGKTTVARSLHESLSSAGISSTYLWCGWRGFESWLFKPFASQTKKAMTRRGSEEIIASAHDKIPFFDCFTWLDYFVRVCPLLVASLLKNTIVVADRYVYDVILTLHADGSKSYRFVVWLFKLFPQPTIIFYVNVPPELAFARKDDIPSLEFLRRSDGEKRRFIAQLPVEVITLDGTRTVQELTEEAFTVTTALIT